MTPTEDHYIVSSIRSLSTRRISDERSQVSVSNDSSLKQRNLNWCAEPVVDPHWVIVEYFTPWNSCSSAILLACEAEILRLIEKNCGLLCEIFVRLNSPAIILNLYVTMFNLHTTSWNYETSKCNNIEFICNKLKITKYIERVVQWCLYSWNTTSIIMTVAIIKT